MTIHSVYILSKSGGLIYQHDHSLPTIENEKTFSYPLELKLEVQNRNVVVSFGQRDGIKGTSHLPWWIELLVLRYSVSPEVFLAWLLSCTAYGLNHKG